MDTWEKSDETTLPPKEVFYSHLKLENIGDKNYAHAQKVWQVFEIKNLLEVNITYPKKLFNSHKDLPFLPERKKVEKVEKEKEKYFIHIRALKQALNHDLKLKQVHRVIQFKRTAWLKTYIDMNTE